MLKAPLPESVLPEPLSEAAEPPPIEKLLGEFEEFVRKSEESRKNPMLLKKVDDFKQECRRQLKTPIPSQVPGMAGQGGWFQGRVKAEAEKVVLAIVEFHQAWGRAPLNAAHNAAARRMSDQWEDARKQGGAIVWDSAPFRPALGSLAGAIAILQNSDPAKATHAQGVAHPKSGEYRDPYMKLAKAMLHKLGVYVERIPYFRMKHYAAAVEAQVSGDLGKALDSASLFISGDRGIDLGGLDGVLVSLADERVQPEMEKLSVAARGMIAGFRGKVRPSTEAQAVLMYEAKDLRHHSKHVEVAPGTWCAYSGKYEGRKSGRHFVRMGDVEYVAFETTEDLSHTPDGVRLTVVGQYEKLIEYTRVLGSTGRAPFLKASLVFKHR